MNILETFLEILKYTIPAIIVYLLFRQFLNHQAIVEKLRHRASMSKDYQVLRLQAYERLILYCERTRLSQLIIRLQNKGMSKMDLKNALIISIQKEFDHNLTQQVYVSYQLWEMVDLLKDQAISQVTGAFISNEHKTMEEFIHDLYNQGEILDSKMVTKVKLAIKKEIELYFQ